MSKEIILDGVNVAECRHLSFVEEDYCCDCQYEKYALCQNSDCHYKQFKRLQAENERLKEEITTLECKLDAEKPSLIIPKPKQLAVPIEEVETYRKALEEIREMFDNCCLKANFLNNCDSDCKYINECNGELSAIQKRISKVLDER